MYVEDERLPACAPLSRADRRARSSPAGRTRGASSTGGVVVGPVWVGPPWEQPPAGRPRSSSILGRRSAPVRTRPRGSRWSCSLEQPRGSLLDIGCGSGVLAIAAAKLGFGPVTAGDDDPEALEVTRENAAHNGVQLDVRALDAVAGELPPADLVVANIALPVVEALARRVRCARLVLSGYLVEERPSVEGFVHLARREAGGWAADAYAPE